MHRERPDIAQRWERETPNIEQLPERIKPRYAKVYENMPQQMYRSRQQSN
jgi:hypothetical protein